MLSEAKLKIAIVVLILITLAFCFLIYTDMGHVKVITVSQFSDRENISFSVDSKGVNNDIVEISGWALEKGQNINTYDTSVALKEKDSDKIYILPTQLVNREDVTKFFNDGFNYDASGFLSRAYTSKLSDSDTKYEIVLLIKNNGKDYVIDTEQTLEV